MIKSILITTLAATTTMADSKQLLEERPSIDQIVMRCGGCHQYGSMGAPKLNDHDEWQKRLIARGMSGLVRSATYGTGGMPARGGQDITDEEVEAAVFRMSR